LKLFSRESASFIDKKYCRVSKSGID